MVPSKRVNALSVEDPGPVTSPTPFAVNSNVPALSANVNAWPVVPTTSGIVNV